MNAPINAHKHVQKHLHKRSYLRSLLTLQNLQMRRDLQALSGRTRILQAPARAIWRNLLQLHPHPYYEHLRGAALITSLRHALNPASSTRLQLHPHKRAIARDNSYFILTRAHQPSDRHLS
jgi:hypothetical protein